MDLTQVIICYGNAKNLGLTTAMESLEVVINTISKQLEDQVTTKVVEPKPETGNEKEPVVQDSSVM
jgi:hypothetical protein